jgi:hypothetical protein
VVQGVAQEVTPSSPSIKKKEVQVKQNRNVASFMAELHRTTQLNTPAAKAVPSIFKTKGNVISGAMIPTNNLIGYNLFCEHKKGNKMHIYFVSIIKVLIYSIFTMIWYVLSRRSKVRILSGFTLTPVPRAFMFMFFVFHCFLITL